MYKPKVGDKVMLNDRGFWVLGGPLSKEESHAAIHEMTVVEVGEEMMEDVWAIDVDGALNPYCLDSTCVDHVMAKMTCVVH